MVGSATADGSCADAATGRPIRMDEIREDDASREASRA
jgi:hypothetical protein